MSGIGIERRIRRLELVAFPDVVREIEDAARKANIPPAILTRQINAMVRAAMQREAETGEDRNTALRAVIDGLRRSFGGG